MPRCLAERVATIAPSPVTLSATAAQAKHLGSRSEGPGALSWPHWVKERKVAVARRVRLSGFGASLCRCEAKRLGG